MLLYLPPFNLSVVVTWLEDIMVGSFWHVETKKHVELFSCYAFIYKENIENCCMIIHEFLQSFSCIATSA